MLQVLLRLFSVIILSAGFSPAYADISLIPNDFEASSYYTVDEATAKTPSDTLVNPLRNFSVSLKSAAQTLLASPVTLTRWLKHSGSPGKPKEAYNRLKHFGRWVNDPNDDECFDTRAKVLSRDSLVPVQYKSSNHCRVATGLWKDPYAGKTLNDARDIQIDHFVPLKDAYISGGWKWSSTKRCLYANFMSNGYHLISVYGVENMIKGDSTPEEYVPSNKAFVCEYLERWLKVKLIWNMNMTASEAQGIRSEFQRNSCDLRAMKMSRKELDEQRKKILTQSSLCEKRAAGL